jgi:hypothetical protein
MPLLEPVRVRLFTLTKADKKKKKKEKQAFDASQVPPGAELESGT